MREWSVDTVSTSPNKATQKREWRVVCPNVISGPLSKSTNYKASEQPQDILMRHFFPGMKSSHLASYDTVWGGVFISSPGVVGRKHLLNWVLVKKRCDKQSRLSDVMRARLGPQKPGIEGKPDMLETLEACLSPSIATIMLEWPSHLPRQ